jgi:hypothetical protein
MNKIIIIIFWLVPEFLFCQKSNFKYFNDKLNNIYLDSTINSDLEVTEINHLDSLLKTIFQTRDSLLELRLIAFIELIMNRFHSQEYISPMSGSEQSLFTTVKNYIEYQKFTKYPHNIIPARIIENNENLNLLDYHEISSDTNFLAQLFRNSINQNQIWYSFHRLNELLDSAQYASFYNENMSYFNSNEDIFISTVVNSFRFHKPFPLASNADSIFIHYADTNITNNLIEYKYFFKNGPWIYDVINLEQKAEWQKLEDERVNEYWANQINEEDSIMNYHDSISTELLKSKCPEAYLAYQDTTLWLDNGQVQVVVGDDGMRFDTFNNDELFNKLNQMNFHNIYDTINSYLDLNSSPTILHLRKIFQLIGDRHIFQNTIPNESQMAFLGNMIDMYVEYIKQDTIPCMSDEATNQIQRLWNLAEFKYVDWPLINNEQLNRYFSVAVDFHCTESLLLEMIRRADMYELAGNHDLAFRYIHPIMYIYNFKYIENIGYAIPPRRPFRTLDDSNRWCKEYIIPALKRFNLIE